MLTDFFVQLRFVYQVVVPKSLAPKDLVTVFEGGNAKVLPPWDPMVRASICVNFYGRITHRIHFPGNACMNIQLVLIVHHIPICLDSTSLLLLPFNNREKT